jgi:gliding motility-associated-like protein
LCLLAYSSILAADYYWVNGSGNWSDITHWATTSGGGVKHNIVPSADDRVFFDAQSFSAANQTITVDNQTIFCSDMNWIGATNNPRIVSTTKNVLNVYGSLRLIDNMTWDFLGEVNFLAGTTGHQVDMRGKNIRKLVNFNGIGGQWTLVSPMVADTMVTLAAGNLVINGQTLTCEHFWVTSVGVTRIDLSTGAVVVTGAPIINRSLYSRERGAAELNGTNNLTIIAGTGRFEFSQPGTLLRYYGERTHTINTILFSSNMGKGRIAVDPKSTLNLSRLEFRNDGEIRGQVNFDDLVLAPGKNYSVESNIVYNIKRLSALGTCQAPIQLFASESGTQATLRATADSIKANFFFFKDIVGSGGARFIAFNGSDLGNSTGWTVTPKANNALYWVGGSGSWDDLSHWSFTSGGPGGACLPTASDNVFFDANSFGAPAGRVNINVENAYCRNMTWTGANDNPILTGGMDKNLHIFGSLTFIRNMQYQFEGDVFLEGSNAGNIVTSAGKVFQKNLIMDGSGSWSLADSLSIKRDFIFLQGDFNTNSQQVGCFNVYSENATTRKLTLGNTKWYLRTVDWNYITWRLNADNLTLDAGNSLIDFNYFGGLNKRGRSGLTYNRINFRQSGSVSHWDFRGVRMKFDTIVASNNISFFSRQEVNVLQLLQLNYDLTIQSYNSLGDTLTVSEILAPNNCEGLVNFKAGQDNKTAYLELIRNLNLSRFAIRDITKLGNFSLTANNSVDLGNNKDITFNTLTGRTLYWVGGSGNWRERTNWSLSSGGSGGECPPTPIDDVIFDSRSFTGPNQTVNAWLYNAYCKNITWTGVSNIPYFFASNVQIFGSATFSKDMTITSGTLHFRGERTDNMITLAGLKPYSVLIDGGGVWTLKDHLSVYYLSHTNGTFNSNNFNVTLDLQYYGWLPGNTRKLQMGSSYWKIINDREDEALNFGTESGLTIEPGSSTLEIMGSDGLLFLYDGGSLNKVLFSGISGTSEMGTRKDTLRERNLEPRATFKHVEFRNNGIIHGINTFDTLILSAGKSYQLDHLRNQTITKFWRMIGNNCNPISLSSLEAGRKSTVNMNSGSILANFVQMRDQLGVGSVRFYAGNNSTNIGNSNQNWIFDKSPQISPVGLLGPDVVLCKGVINLNLDANTFVPGERYQWTTGSTSNSIAVSQPGRYGVAVTYNSNCVLRDTLNILQPRDFSPDLPNDTTLCVGESIILRANKGHLEGATFRWSDGSTADTLVVTRAGKYKVTMELSGCISSDSINISILDNQNSVNLGPDITKCVGQTHRLRVNSRPGTRILWNDNSTDSVLVVNQPGVYSIQVFEGRCSAKDTVRVTYNPSIGLNLGRDTVVCEGGRVTLTANVDNAVYRWSDNSPTRSINASQPGRYWVDVTKNGCTETDTIRLINIALPRFNLGPDTALCTGQSLQLMVVNNTPGLTYRWSSGATTSSITVSGGSALVGVTVTDRGCAFNDSRTINFNPVPVFNLPAVRGLCEGESTTLDVSLPNAAYRWQDGNTAARYVVTRAGLYFVDVTVNGCTLRDSSQINFSPAPRFTLGRDTSLCADLSLNIGTTPVNGVTYRWDDGATTASRGVNASGTYTLTSNRNGCTFIDDINVTFKPLPTVNLGNDQSPCQGQPVSLNATQSGTATYRWSDSSTGSTLAVTQNGSYSVEVTSNGCSKRDTVRVNFVPLPRFALGLDTALCSGQSFRIGATLAGAAYRWSTNETSPFINVNTSGTYSLTVTVGSCSFTDERRVLFNPSPVLNLGLDRGACQGETISLNVTQAGAAYRWQDGSTSGEFLARQTGNYSVEVSLNNCFRRDTLRLTFNPIPSFNLGRDSSLCDGEILALNGTVNGATYRWNDNVSTATRQVTQAGLYWLEVTLNGCSKRDSVNVRVVNLPRRLFGRDTMLCEGQNLRLNINAPGATFRWQDGSTSNQFLISQAGLYSLEARNGRCRSTDSLQVGYNPLPRFNLGRDTTLCDIATLTLRVPLSPDAIRWNDNSTGDSLRVTKAGQYIANVIESNCRFADTISVVYRETPKFSLGKDTMVCDDRIYLLEPQPRLPESIKLTWSTGTGIRALPLNKNETDKQFWLLAENGLCKFSDTVNVSFRDCAYFKAYIPSAFSPNLDQVNDDFKPLMDDNVTITSYLFRIFDRWGNLVFETNDQAKGWDGTAKGKKVPEGVYLYFLDVTFKDDLGPGSRKITGDVALIK